MTSSLGSVVCQNGSQNSKKYFTYCHQFIIRDIAQEQLSGDTKGNICVKRGVASCPLQITTLLVYGCLQQSGIILNPSPLSLYGDFLMQPWLIKSLAINSVSSHSPLLRDPRMGLKDPTIQSHGWFLQQPAPILRYLEFHRESPH